MHGYFSQYYQVFKIQKSYLEIPNNTETFKAILFICINMEIKTKSNTSSRMLRDIILSRSYTCIVYNGKYL